MTQLAASLSQACCCQPRNPSFFQWAQAELTRVQSGNVAMFHWVSCVLCCVTRLDQIARSIMANQWMLSVRLPPKYRFMCLTSNWHSHKRAYQFSVSLPLAVPVPAKKTGAPTRAFLFILQKCCSTRVQLFLAALATSIYFDFTRCCWSSRQAQVDINCPLTHQFLIWTNKFTFTAKNYNFQKCRLSRMTVSGGSGHWVTTDNCKWSFPSCLFPSFFHFSIKRDQLLR